ncbi:putative DNA translocase [Selenomonas ruminantium subsp. lactilytica TAM6421]|uniref:Putative DNA translocase n=1 Tax=Selenomonas ruminantium subsp. lactilytica (strain NBRC 103574 / TAM6421) TaxID=927704 RepID=I0GQ62_SELRL|nr:DNA translocase FtsK [Selenomonas ruminantium]BAL82899.1 putative DNA translocase [Selenomonas ruminantium subsp. lactilytica TAM6421]
MSKKVAERKTAPRRRKASGRKKAAAKPAANPERKYELWGLFLVAVSLISICGLCGLNVGFVGVYFAKCLHYMFGVGAIVISLLILLIGYQYIVKHHGLVYSPRFFGLGLLFLSVLAIWHHCVIDPGAEILPESLPKGGGLLAGGLLLILRKFFGVDGSIILLGAGVIGSILLSTTWSLANGVLRTQRTAAKSAAATGKAMAVAYEKVADVSERMEEKVVEKVKSSFYNQEDDDHFAQAPLDSTAKEKPEAVVAADTLAEEPAAEDLPKFTIEYGRSDDEPENEAEEEEMGLAEDFVPLDMSNDRSNLTRQIDIQPAIHVAQPKPVAPSAKPMKDAAKRTAMPSYGEIAPIRPAAAILDGSEKAVEEVPKPVKPYELPKVTEILSKHVKAKNTELEREIADNAITLQQTLADFKVKANILNACHGPAVTRYELEPAPGVKVSKITNLADDIALRLAAASVRIEQIPGKSAIGIEVPNKELEGVQLREVLENTKFDKAKSKLTVGLGMDIGGQGIFADLGKMPHLLVAGATGSGKSVCINTLITSILFKAKPDEVKFILVDPKMVELSNYNGIPHLMVPVVTDAKKAASVLNWSVQEMEKRYSKFAEKGVRNMQGYNDSFPDDKMPAIVIIIDELADLMMVAPHDVEDAICRLAQKARAAGIHMVLATQRPSVDVITGIIKANVPSRISFAVSSQIDSRTILDRSGAEKLLGRGDMLFFPIGASKPRRVQGAFISDGEVEKLLDFIRAQGQEMEPNEEIEAFTQREMEAANEEESGKGGARSAPKTDALLNDAVNLVMSTGQASASSIQRRFHIGYTRAARLIDTMEELNIVGPNLGSKPREILMTTEEALDVLANT